MKEFLDLVDLFLSGKISYHEFEQQVNEFYVVDDTKFDNLLENESDFVYDVYEKTTYTAEGLPKNDSDRRYGVIDVDDFKSWLAEMKEKNIKFWE